MYQNNHDCRVGATLFPTGTARFEVWAPRAQQVRVVFSTGEEATLKPQPRGYHIGTIEHLTPGVRYSLRLDGGPLLPDPASLFQPEGVHGPSELVDLTFRWNDGGWRNRDLRDHVIYELHVGTFTPEGTFAAVANHLDRLCELGITAVEIMPVGQFPGTRNWGYDGVDLYAVQNSYGGPKELQALVDRCHAKGLAVLLDVVYNHLGPEGNYLREFGPYFTDTYRTPWGEALNFDGRGSDEVRRFFIDNALMWLRDFHFDGLRLDAVHAINDRSPVSFLAQLSQAVEQLSATTWRRHLIAESDANDPRLIRPRVAHGQGMDAVWADDLHHCIHASITGETHGYYQDYRSLDLLCAALRGGFAYVGQHSEFRDRRHGARAHDCPSHQFIVCSQNHDQVGNRRNGDRTAALVPFPAQKLSAALAILAPQTPLLFMGQEYGERRPFLYFTSHGDAELATAVRDGRKREFAELHGKDAPPDPQDVETFLSSVIDPTVRDRGEHRALENLHRAMIRLRSHAAFGDAVQCERHGAVVIVRYERDSRQRMVAAFNLEGRPAETAITLPSGRWKIELDSSRVEFGGRGGTPCDPEGEVWAVVLAPHAFLVTVAEVR